MTTETATLMVGIANKLRQMKADGRIFYTCSTRDLTHWATLTTVLGLDRAFEVAVMNKADTDRQEIHKVYTADIAKLPPLFKAFGVDTVDKLVDELKKRTITLNELKKDVEGKVKELEGKKDQIVKEFLKSKITNAISSKKPEEKHADEII